MIEGREIKEITVDKPSEELMVVVPLKEYRKLVKKVARLKAEKKGIINIFEETDRATREDYRRWWQQEETERKNVEAELEAAKARITELQVAIDLINNKEPSNE